MFAIALAALTALATGSGPQSAAAGGSDPSTWRLGPSGIGPLQLGMNPAKARSVIPGLRIAHHRFCDTWIVPGLDSISLFSTHSRGALSSASISAFDEDLQPGHGAGGVEVGDSVHELKQTFGKRLRFIENIRSVRKAFYRVLSPGGRQTAIEFTVNTGNGRIEYEQAGFLGEFYYTDGTELCA
ncbi:MAG TPA: hypothetical protein VD761_11310 [Solirubrobacterales bacterium]|nr:hypothetical protein [Solirubrobacterales bacterium]